MKYDRQLLCWAGVLLGTIVVLTGCAYDPQCDGCLSLNRPSFISIGKS